MEFLSVQNISKSYRDTKALDRVSFVVPAQSIFGMLGPNGAGKTTTIRIITTILQPESGQILFRGEPLTDLHSSRMGYMPEERGLYKKMKVWEQLLYLARLKGMPAAAARKKIFEWMDKLEMKTWWNKKVDELSKGMQQKVQFVATVLHEPELIILDEPFTGLDPINTQIIKSEIESLRRNGTTVIFSTHRMEQVEEICEHIVLYNKGKIILDGEVQAIRQRFKENKFNIQFEGAWPEFESQTFHEISRHDHSASVTLQPGARTNDLLRELLDRQVMVTGFHEILPGMNDIFISQVEAQKHE